MEAREGRDRTIVRIAPKGTRLLDDERLTEAVTVQLETWLRRGVSIDMACRFSGISTVKFRRWLSKGEEDPEDETHVPSEPYITFASRIRAAEAEVVETSLNFWLSSEDWRAHAKFLASRYPDEYSERRVQKPESYGPSTINVTIGPRPGDTTSSLPDFDPEAMDAGQGQGNEVAAAVPGIDSDGEHDDQMGGSK